MTDEPIDQQGGAGESHEPIEQMPVEAPRRASLTLRADDARQARAASMEAANKSLADALRLTYRGLLLLMGALVLVFVFTGVEQVNESEEGLKVTFGRIVEKDLDPGAHFNLPFPLGGIINVSMGQRNIEIDKAFVPAGFRPDRGPDQQGVGTATLNPGRDGALMTADGSLVHARASAIYRVTDSAEYVSNLSEDEERGIVRAVIESAMVQAVAGVTIDDLLSRAAVTDDGPAVGSDSIERRIRASAQAAIEGMGVGLEIEEVSLTNIFPPIRVRQHFLRANQVDSQSSQAREEAEKYRRRTLNEIAGSAHRPLLDLIDDVERFTDQGDEAAAERVLATIYEVLDKQHSGANIEISGRTYAEVSFFGLASETILNAKRTRQLLVDNAKRDASVFRAKLAQYRAEPTSFLHREVSEALLEFLSRDHVQQYFAPSAAEFEILLNNDPDIARELQRARQEELTREFLRKKGEIE